MAEVDHRADVDRPTTCRRSTSISVMHYCVGGSVDDIDRAPSLLNIWCLVIRVRCWRGLGKESLKQVCRQTLIQGLFTLEHSHVNAGEPGGRAGSKVFLSHCWQFDRRAIRCVESCDVRYNKDHERLFFLHFAG